MLAKSRIAGAACRMIYSETGSMFQTIQLRPHLAKTCNVSMINVMKNAMYSHMVQMFTAPDAKAERADLRMTSAALRLHDSRARDRLGWILGGIPGTLASAGGYIPANRQQPLPRYLATCTCPPHASLPANQAALRHASQCVCSVSHPSGAQSLGHPPHMSSNSASCSLFILR